MKLLTMKMADERLVAGVVVGERGVATLADVGFDSVQQLIDAGPDEWGRRCLTKTRQPPPVTQAIRASSRGIWSSSDIYPRPSRAAAMRGGRDGSGSSRRARRATEHDALTGRRQ